MREIVAAVAIRCHFRPCDIADLVRASLANKPEEAGRVAAAKRHVQAQAPGAVSANVGLANAVGGPGGGLASALGDHNVETASFKRGII